MAERQLIAHPTTKQSRSDVSDLMLLGTVTTPDGALALLRQNGDVMRVSVGDTIGAQTVTAIDDAAVYLGHGSAQTVLQMPG
ncbi:hypothetical protein O4H61_02015 [Roseovarius aestuarii]|nr:hypothetical protein [Roseovarius aestuarii]